MNNALLIALLAAGGFWIWNQYFGGRDVLADYVGAVNYYKKLAVERGIPTDMEYIASWEENDGQITYFEETGLFQRQGFYEFSQYVDTNTKQIAAATGDWSHYQGA